jgi:hypothetical protein
LAQLCREKLQADPFSGCFNGFEFMRAEEHHLAARSEFLNEAAQNEPGAGIEAGENKAANGAVPHWRRH